MVCNEFVLETSFRKFKAFTTWILLLDDKTKTTPLLHPLAISLPKQFQFLFPEEIPSRLLPKRDIQHHIDIIPKAILLNKLAHRMDPEDTMEVHR